VTFALFVLFTIRNISFVQQFWRPGTSVLIPGLTNSHKNSPDFENELIRRICEVSENSQRQPIISPAAHTHYGVNYRII